MVRVIEKYDIKSIAQEYDVEERILDILHNRDVKPVTQGEINRTKKYNESISEYVDSYFDDDGKYDIKDLETILDTTVYIGKFR